MKKNFTITALLLCLIVLVTYDVLFVAMRKDTSTPVHTPQPASAPVAQSDSSPVHIRLPRLGIDIPVEVGRYNPQKKTWTLSWSAASFASMTATPNAHSGRTIIYAHNTKKTFGPTKNIQPGDIVSITNQDGDVYTYTFMKEVEVAPNDASIFRDVAGGPPELVLLTCGGLFNETRRLMHFTYIGIEDNTI